ncbi:hypothetical protein [Roseibium sp.]|uniref:hypothetical protein n=1 Tax=Roseibium sp. TaxID=1936156 RepID=UPI003BA911D5
MPTRILDFAEPFFTVSIVTGETTVSVGGKAILLNLAEKPVRIFDQMLEHLQSTVIADVDIRDVDKAILIERFDDYPDTDALFDQVKRTWPSAYDVRQEERLRGVSHYMSPKVWIGRIGLTMYHSGSVPLNVGLHRDHPFCPVPGFREVHTQVVGFGKMQQCREKDPSTLYLEEPMAPGTTHRPMYDAEGNYPWHQFETITPSIFMAVEMLPEGAQPPA